MNKVFLFLSLVIFSSFNAVSQESINNYKYIIIPAEYGFLNEPDQYQLNSLTKFLFNKYGYTALIKTETLPEDLAQNRCLALYADVIKEKGGLFKTKLRIDLKNCNDKVIMSSKIGESREKEYEKTYNLALRDAFETFQNFNYKYEPSSKIAMNSSVIKAEDAVAEKFKQSKEELERLQKEIETLKEEKEAVAAEPKAEVKKEVVEAVKQKPVAKPSETLEVLYAQPIDNGFQIVDTTPKKVMVLFYSGIPDTFIVKDRDALVYKKEGLWILAENNGTTLKTEVVNIKF